jgi:hypothetical protein
MKKKTPKFSLINGLWIGHTHDLLPKLTPIEESLIARYLCITILIKLRYYYNFLICQITLKGNISNFA